MPLEHPAADVLDAARRLGGADARRARLPPRRARDLLRRASRTLAPCRAGPRRSRGRAGRPRGDVAAQRAGLSNPLFRPARGWAPSPSRSTRGTARSRLPTSSAAPAPRCWPARQVFGAYDFLSILAEVEPAALDMLAALVIVGDEPADAARRDRATAPRAVRPNADSAATRRQQRLAQGAVQHLHHLGHDQARRSSWRIARARSPATPSRSHAASASTPRARCRSRSCRCGGVFASTRRWAPSPAASPRCW